MGSAMSCFHTKEPAEKPYKDVNKCLKKMEKTIKKHPSITDDEWLKAGTKICKKLKKEQIVQEKFSL